MNEDENRRRTDPLLIEVHGMLKEHIAHFSDHMASDAKGFKDLGDRLQPVEELNRFIRVLLTIGKALLAVGGMGGVAAGAHMLMSWGKHA